MDVVNGGRLVNVKQLADLLGVPRSWVYQRTADGSIPMVRVGRYVRFDVRRVMDWLQTEQETARQARAH